MRISKGPRHYVKKIKGIASKNQALANRIERYKTKAGKIAIKRRGYTDYNKLFKIGFNKSIIETLVGMGKKRLSIIDDGAGVGNFLAEIKSQLLNKGIISKTTALTLTPNENLEKRKINGVIDNVVVGPAEYYVPKKPVDAIFSLFGSITYTDPSVRKEHVLKFAHSLKKGGIMMVGFHFVKSFDRLSSESILWGLSKNPNPSRRMKIETETRGIEKAFRKQGFEAKFTRLNPISSEQLPNYILIVRRIK